MDSRSGKNCVGWLAKAESEMPTSGDLKAGESLFHHPTGISTDTPPHPPPDKLTQPPIQVTGMIDRDDRMGAKMKAQRFQTKPIQILGPKFNPPPPPHEKKKIPSHKIFQKALNDITQK